MENPDSTKEYQKREIGKILENTKNYRVQFIGVLHEGKKVIRCNFFPSPRNGEKDEFPRWKQQRVEVKDGGFWFWQIDYDPDTGKCMNFISMDTDRTPIEPI